MEAQGPVHESAPGSEKSRDGRTVAPFAPADQQWTSLAPSQREAMAMRRRRPSPATLPALNRVVGNRAVERLLTSTERSDGATEAKLDRTPSPLTSQPQRATPGPHSLPPQPGHDRQPSPGSDLSTASGPGPPGHSPTAFASAAAAPPGLVQRRGPDDGPEFSGLETELTFEKQLTKQLAARIQGEILYNPSSGGPVKLSKGILKITKKAGKDWGGAVAVRAATLDPLSTSTADDLFALVGLSGEEVRKYTSFEVKVFEVEMKKGSKIPSVALLKIEWKAGPVDLTQMLADANADFAAAHAKATAAGHELRVRGHVAVQWSVPLEQIALRNPYAAAFIAGSAAGLGVTWFYLSELAEAGGTAGGAFLDATSAAEGVGSALVRAMDTAFYRPAFEVLLMADPENMDFDRAVSDDEVGAITEIGLAVQDKIWNSTDTGSALKSIELPMSAFATRADMEVIAAAGRRIGAVDDYLLDPAVLLTLKPKAFFQRLWDAAILSWFNDPDIALEDVEAAFLRGDWKPSVAGG